MASTGVAGELRIPVLMYHHIRDPLPSDSRTYRDLSCPPAQFDDHLEVLAEEGYTPVTFELLHYLAQDDDMVPEKPIVLTFDDGPQDQIHAARALLDRGWLGVFFVTTRTLGDGRHFTRRQLRAMRWHGMEIGSHTESHPDLTQLSDRRLAQEVARSKDTLEEILEGRVFSFSYPAGRHDARVVDAVQAAGYSFARTTRRGVSDIRGAPFRLRTIRIHDTTTGYSLRRTLRRVEAAARSVD